MLGAFHILRSHFGGGGQAKVFQLITIYRGGIWVVRQDRITIGGRVLVSNILGLKGNVAGKPIAIPMLNVK